MPVQRCTKGGKSGWRWGKSGKCYTGSGAKAKAAKQGAAIKAAGFQEHDDIDMRSSKVLFQKITTNFTGVVRNDTMEGRDYMVVPMIMIVEGVHEGSNGPLYYPAEELSKTPAVWNHKPVVVYHPQANGEGISACDPDILTNRKVGVIMNAAIGDVEVNINKEKTKLVALKAEAWLEVDRMKKVDERIAEAVEKNEMMELSTGLFTDNESMEGEWNGETYTAIARNYRPDHLALLPDLKGACSIEDGAGFLRLNEAKDAIIVDVSTMSDKEQKYILADKNGILRTISHNLAKIISNEISFDDTRQRLHSIIKGKFGDDEPVWIEDVFDKYFVYERNDRLFKQDYEDIDGSISLTGLPVEVVKDIKYNPITNERKIKMEKKESIVEELIKNESTKWSKEDRDTLMELDEDVLNKMSPVMNEDDNKDEDKGKGKDDEKASESENEGDNKDEEKEGKEEESVENMTADEYINKKVPNELKGVFQSGLASYRANKSRLINIITSNEKNVFTKEQLEAKDLDELKSLVALAIHTDEQKGRLENLNYAGQGDPVHNETEEEPMDVPVLNFGEKK